MEQLIFKTFFDQSMFEFEFLYKKLYQNFDYRENVFEKISIILIWAWKMVEPPTKKSQFFFFSF